MPLTLRRGLNQSVLIGADTLVTVARISQGRVDLRFEVSGDRRALTSCCGIGEPVTIGNDTRITVAKIKDGCIELRVDAPRSTPILRAELLDRLADG